MFDYIKYIPYLCGVNIRTDMTNERKYKIGCAGSGWAIWSTTTGEKVMQCRSHYHAVESLYNLMGWNWNPSKYRG